MTAKGFTTQESLNILNVEGRRRNEPVGHEVSISVETFREAPRVGARHPIVDHFQSWRRKDRRRLRQRSRRCESGKVHAEKEEEPDDVEFGSGSEANDVGRGHSGQKRSQRIGRRLLLFFLSLFHLLLLLVCELLIVLLMVEEEEVALVVAFEPAPVEVVRERASSSRWGPSLVWAVVEA